MTVQLHHICIFLWGQVCVVLSSSLYGVLFWQSLYEHMMLLTHVRFQCASCPVI